MKMAGAELMEEIRSGQVRALMILNKPREPSDWTRMWREERAVMAGLLSVASYVGSHERVPATCTLL